MFRLLSSRQTVATIQLHNLRPMSSGASKLNHMPSTRAMHRNNADLPHILIVRVQVLDEVVISDGNRAGSVPITGCNHMYMK
uniref:Secreted protein n=1 Tax=Steinernema glaseri TaxID=37863 RepID=A0A1I7YQX1_9BILA